MDYTIQHRENDKRGMFWIESESGKISELTYTVQDSSTIIVDHTETKMEFEHQGYASKLLDHTCLLYTSPSPRDRTRSRMPSSA